MKTDLANHASMPSGEQFLLNRINYERALAMPTSEEAFKLDRMRELLERLENPQNSLPIIHIAGTKGKGSTAAMMAAVLTAAGYKTGLFTSPHLDRVEERIVVDGQICPSDTFAALIEAIQPVVETMDRKAAALDPPEPGPTYFEIITAAALYHFAQCGANAVVLEVGLGGRLDSTNVCTPALSIITSISFDHTKQLGHTLAAIAGEKAGIIKPGVPVVSGVTAEEAQKVVRDVARRHGSRLVELGVDFDFSYRPPQHLEAAASPAFFDFSADHLNQAASKPSELHNMALGLLGSHQAANAALVVAGVELLRQTGWAISDTALREGLASVVWPARIEIIARHPAIVLDAAHNRASIAALTAVLDESFAVRRRHLIFATTREKDLHGMLEYLLDHFDHIIFTRYLNNPRNVPPDELLTAAESLRATRPQTREGQAVRTAHDERKEALLEIAPTPAEAWEIIHRIAEPDDLICITGSFFIAAEMRSQILLQPFQNRTK